MKYRIKIETYKNGDVKYYPQYYRGLFSGWKSLYKDGDKSNLLSNIFLHTRQQALEAIDLCETGKNEVISITFENINYENK